MITRDFQGKKLSLLGFGTMRLPLTDPKDPGSIDEEKAEEMIRCAIRAGVNYFDTAAPYHKGKSETVLGKILSRFPRDSYYLADKYPGHQVFREYNPEETFEWQLKKCGVDYFDFYLLHNVFENSIHTYNDPKWGIMDYFIRQKKEGRIKHLGFSSHGGIPVMRDFLDRYGEHMEFCQIQINYLDWSLQDARAKVEFLKERGIPIWVMEPVRGGKLARLTEPEEAALAEMRPDHSPAAWAFRFVQDIPEVTVILSGMSDLAQVQDNLNTFRKEQPLSQAEREFLFSVARRIQNSVPCTSCGYCTASCPAGLDIPFLLSIYNEVSILPSFNAAMRVEMMDDKKKPSACIGCGKCARMCPQSIDIPETLKKLSRALETIPSWKKVSQEREEIARKETKK